jgi:D-glycero-D-manno-heptose 1,7-bisphosphate phosphatase
VGVHPLKKAAVFLDRDGVLNRALVRDGRPYAPRSFEEFELLPGVAPALRRLADAGYARVVVTNQPDVGRGRLDQSVVEAMHAQMLSLLPLDEVRVCYHGGEVACPCRKPAPGMLLEPPNYDVPRSVMVGDRWRDVEAGRAAGCRATILVDYAYPEPLPHEPDARVASLGEAVDWILANLGHP